LDYADHLLNREVICAIQIRASTIFVLAVEPHSPSLTSDF
jgi:hypothetical protein